MKNNSKRICALLLAVVMCITRVGPVFAESDAHVHSETVTCPGATVEHTMTNAPVVFVKTVPAECGKFGYDLYECATCKTPVVTNWTEIGNGDHSWGAWVETTAPTCDEFGVETATCQNEGCGVTKTQPIAKRQHNIVDDKSSDLYCKDGIPAWSEWCSYDDCDYKVNHGATPGTACDRYVAEIVKQPNCYETGLAIVKCENCKYESLEVVVNATNSGLGHTWVKVGDFTTAPTCGTAGSGNVECSVCQATAVVTNGKVSVTYTVGGVATTTEIAIAAFAATGIHDFSVDVGPTAPDCDDNGVLAHKKCSTCDAVSLDGTTAVDASALVDPATGHTWTDVDATAHGCETDGILAHHKCSVCNALSFNKTDIVTEADIVDPAKHDYDLTVPVADSDPSCTKYGFWFYGCGVCGLPSNVTGDTSTTDAPIPSTAPAGSEWVSNGILRLPKFPHAWALDSTDSRNNAGDCTTDKVEVYKCTCGAEEVRPTTAPGHTWTTTEVKANCQHGGYKIDTCACGATRIDDTTEADGKYDVVASEPNVHSWDPTKTVITTSPTCTDEGIALDWCIYCGAYESHKVDALGHNSFEYVETVLPTCTAAGYLVYKCDRCHAESTEVELAPSALTAYHEDYAANSALNLAALGHSFEGVDPIHTGATCSNVGSDRYNCVRFGNCGYYETKVLKDDGTALYPALNHTYLATGLTSLHRVETLPTCDKTSADPTVGIAGYITEKCYQCDYSVKVGDIEFDHENAKHHPNSVINPDTTWTDGVYWPGSCDRPKLVDYYCPTCEKQFYAADYTMVGDHAPKSGTEVAANGATCVTDGNYAHYVCEKCDNKVYINADGEKLVYTDDATVVIPATGHTWTDVQAVAPDCVTPGAKAYSYCACGAYTLDKTAETVVTFAAAELDAKIFVAANGHAWGTIIPEVPASCDTAGTEAHYDCANCDALSLDAITTHTAADLVIAPKNHVGYMVDSQLVEATCLTAGYQYHYCTLCGYEYVDNYVYAKGHTFGALVNKVEPDCDSTGFEAYYECSECNKKFISNEKFNANAKTDAELTIAATGIHVNAAGNTILDKCTDATEDRACVGCGTTIAATHTALTENDVDATCTEYGYTVKYCKDCGYEKVEKKSEFAPTGHNYQWVETTPAGIYTEGVETEKCVAGNGSAGCGDVKGTRPIAPTGGINFTFELDNAIVSGAEYVNGGKIKLTIKYQAANVDLANIAIRLNYDASLLTFVSGDFKCDIVDPATELRIFDVNNAAIGGKTPGFVYITAKTTGFGELAADKNINGEGVFAEIYFNINKDVVAGSTIDFDVAVDGNSASAVLKADGTKVAATFGDVAAETTKALADIDIDGVYNNADEVEFLDIAFSNNYVAAADINQDGFIGLDDYSYLFDLLLGNITYAELCAAAQSK